MKISTLIFCFLIVLISGCSGDNSNLFTSDTTTEGNQVDHGNGFYNTRRIERNALGAITSDLIYEVDTGNNQVTRSRVLESGEKVLVGIFYYNEFGYTVRDEQFDENGSIEEKLYYFYDANGRIVERRRENEEDAELNRTRSFEYDAQGRVIDSEERLSSSDQLVVKRTYQYNEAGQLITKIISAYDQGIKTTTHRSNYFYNQLNQQIARNTDFDSDGTVENNRTLEYDTKGNVVLRTVTDDTGAIVDTTTFEYTAIDEPIYNVWVRRFIFFP